MCLLTSACARVCAYGEGAQGLARPRPAPSRAGRAPPPATAPAASSSPADCSYEWGSARGRLDFALIWAEATASRRRRPPASPRAGRRLACQRARRPLHRDIFVRGQGDVAGRDLLLASRIEQAPVDGADELEDDNHVAPQSPPHNIGASSQRGLGSADWGVFGSMKVVLFRSKLNLLIPCGFLAILIDYISQNQGWVFPLSLLGIIPLAERLGFATDAAQHFRLSRQRRRLQGSIICILQGGGHRSASCHLKDFCSCSWNFVLQDANGLGLKVVSGKDYCRVVIQYPSNTVSKWTISYMAERVIRFIWDCLPG